MNFKENESATKLRGGYYTPADIASFLTRWALARGAQRILEPSCGDGVFFRAIAKASDAGLKQVTGFEIEPSEAVTAQASADLLTSAEAQVHTCDFIGWALARMNGDPAFDAVLGNPPFVRYQYLDSDTQARAEKVFGVLRLPFTRHTNAWVPFVLASLALLRPGGRLAMVLPAELLHVLHAQGLRSHLAQQCSRILIVDPEELWFADALQGAVLLLAEKKHSSACALHGVAIVRVRNAQFLADDPEDLFASADYVGGNAIAGKWMPALLSRRQRAALQCVESVPGVQRFSAIADVDVGIVTGANKFFLVPDSVVEQYELHEWAHPMFGRSDHVQGVIYDDAAHQSNRDAGLPTNFLWFKSEPANGLPKRAKEYIRAGEAAKLPTRYKCRIRTPWYRVPSVYATPVGMLKRSHEFPRLVLNRLGAFTTDTAYRIRPRRGSGEDLVFSFVNTLTALSAELEGRHYGGGVLELVPSEIERLLIPVVQATARELLDLDALVRRRLVAEDVLFTQDTRVLGRLGVGDDEITSLQEAWSDLRNRRQRITVSDPED